MTVTLITGMSGVGKSTVIAALRQRGLVTLDMDAPGWWYRDAHGAQRWHTDRVHDFLTEYAHEQVFVSGCSEDQAIFYDRCSAIILLSAPWPIMRQRLLTRTTNSYGSQPSELYDIQTNVSTIEPLLRQRATHEIDTTQPLAAVVDQVLAASGLG